MDFEWFWIEHFRLLSHDLRCLHYLEFFELTLLSTWNILTQSPKSERTVFYRCQGPDFLKGRGLCKLRAQLPIQILIPDCIWVCWLLTMTPAPHATWCVFTTLIMCMPNMTSGSVACKGHYAPVFFRILFASFVSTRALKVFARKFHPRRSIRKDEAPCLNVDTSPAREGEMYDWQ